MTELELFHATNDAGSAAARRRIVELHLKIRFRNVFYEEVQKDFAAHGGSKTPALWDGEKLIQGEAKVLAALEKLGA